MKSLYRLKRERFPIQVKNWFIVPSDEIALNESLLDHGLDFDIYISAYDINEPDIYYFHITIKKLIEKASKEIVLKAETESVFKCTIDKKFIPTPAVIFRLMREATLDFISEFNKRTPYDSYGFREIAKPKIKDLGEGIQRFIYEWNSTSRQYGTAQDFS